MKIILKHNFLFASILIVFTSVNAQPWYSPYNLAPPLSGTLYLSGAFGEVRTDHFHSGVDFRTGGKVGAKVFASEKGFISRIRISATGFGKAIYINHPNGLTTTYAHLDRFTEKLEQFIKEQQYRDESFEVDVYLKPEQFPVNRGELIGWSGNSGSSGGPHLHYEVRRASNQNPLNPHFSNLPIVDTIHPSVKSAWFYPITPSSTLRGLNNKTELNVQGNGKSFASKDTVMAYGSIGIGIEAYDYINVGSTRCGVYALTLYVNNMLYYCFSVDEFSFGETRYVNSHIDYALRQQTSQRVHKLFLEPNNRFSAYREVKNKGVVDVKTDSIYNIEVLIGDAYGNVSHFTAILKGDKPGGNFDIPQCPIEGGKQVEWLFYKENRISDNLFNITLPENSLYNNLTFTYGSSDPLPGAYSRVIHIHNNLTPVHKAYTLMVKADSLPKRLESKALLGTFDSKGKIEAVDGVFKDGFVVASLRSFGDYFILVDTIAPQVLPLNFSNGKNMKSTPEIRFRVKDNFSGISSIKGLINGKWALFEFDPKNDLVFYKIDPQRLTPDKKHKISLTVEDKKGNVARFDGTFFW